MSRSWKTATAPLWQKRKYNWGLMVLSLLLLLTPQTGAPSLQDILSRALEHLAGRAVNLTTSPGNAITPGSCWNFQYWFRRNDLPGLFDLSDGLEVIFGI